MPDSSRRSFLAATSAAGTALLAGCDALSSPPTARVELTADRQSADDFAFVWEPDGPGAAESREAIDAAVAGERYVTVGYPPIPDDEYVHRDGTYYRTETVPVGRETTQRYVLRLEQVGDTESEDTPEATSIDALPEPDRGAARVAYFAARAAPDEPGGEWGGAPWAGIERGGAVYRRTDPADSELIPEPDHQYIETELGIVLRVHVARERLTEVVLRADVTPIADTRPGFTEAVLAAELTTTFRPDQLPREAVTVLDDLTEQSEYAESAPVSAGYARVLQRLDLGRATTLPTDGDERLPSAERRAFEYDGDYFEAYFAARPGGEE